MTRPTSARGFDGYKGHAAIDPDSEIITATTVTPGNAGDVSAAEDLIADLLGEDTTQAQPQVTQLQVTQPEQVGSEPAVPEPAAAGAQDSECPPVYGDNAYGTGPFHDRLGEAGIDLGAGTVTCPAGIRAPDPPGQSRWPHRLLLQGLPRVPAACTMHHRRRGRTIRLGPHE